MPVLYRLNIVGLTIPVAILKKKYIENGTIDKKSNDAHSDDKKTL